MNVPKSFKNKIKSTFYDKTLTRHDAVVAVDDEGWARVSEPTVIGTFKGNVNFSNLNEVQERYGIRTDITATVTTDEQVANGEIVGYLGQLFRVTKAVAFDSHTLLILEEWSSKSSTSTSA